MRIRYVCMHPKARKVRCPWSIDTKSGCGHILSHTSMLDREKTVTSTTRHVLNCVSVSRQILRSPTVCFNRILWVSKLKSKLKPFNFGAPPRYFQFWICFWFQTWKTNSNLHNLILNRSQFQLIQFWICFECTFDFELRIPLSFYGNSCWQLPTSVFSWNSPFHSISRFSQTLLVEYWK